MSKVTEIKHPLILHKLAYIRSKDTGSKYFRELVEEVSMLMAYEVTRDLETEEVEVETPICKTKCQMLAGKKMAIVPILRAGLGMVDGILNLIPFFAFGIFQANPHLQTIRLHQIQRAQYAVQTRQHTQMLLGKIEVGFTEVFRLQTGIDITFKRQNRLASVSRGEIRVPLVKAGRVKIGQLVADAHQRGDLRRRELARFTDQLL